MITKEEEKIIFTNEKDKETHTPLMSAAIGKDINDLKKLINAGVNPNARSLRGSTAIMFAAQGGSKDCLEYLLEHGAELEDKNRAGWGVLAYAAFSENCELVKWLLEEKKLVPTDEDINKAALAAVYLLDEKILIYLLRRFGDKVKIESIQEAAKNQFMPIKLSDPAFSNFQRIKKIISTIRDSIVNNCLDEIDLKHRNSTILTMILEVLPKNTSIRKLRCISLNELSKEEKDNLLLFLKTNPNLEELIFDRALDNQALQLVANALLQNTLKLKKISIEGMWEASQMDLEGARILAQLLAKNPIENLELIYCALHPPEATTILNVTPKLKFLDLTGSNNDFTGASVVANLRGLNHLQSLSLRNNYELANSISALADVIAAYTSLTELDLSDIPFNDSHAQDIAKIVENTTLMTLRMKNNCIRNGVPIINALKSSRLRHIYFENTDVRNSCFNAETTEALGKALAINTCLQTLNLYGQLGMKDLSPAYSGFTQNDTLTSLDLGDIGIDEKNFNGLLDAIKDKFIENLSVDSTELGNNIVEKLVALLKTNKILTNLTIKHNCIDTAGKRSIVDALRYNAKLRNFIIEINDAVKPVLIGTLELYNCTLMEIGYYLAPRFNSKEDSAIKRYLERNKKLSNNEDLKSQFDQIQKDRANAKPPLPNQPYSLRLCALFFCQKLDLMKKLDPGMEADIKNIAYSADKQAVIQSFLLTG